MCGILGYIGGKSAAPIILEGLRRLEYRGYDSAGIAMIEGDNLSLLKKQGKIDRGLAKLMEGRSLNGKMGIGHTRWATHGLPSDENSHPHLDATGTIALVHNGIIENYESLRSRLLAKGHEFKSTTDSEVLAHLIGDYYATLKNANDDSPELFSLSVQNALKEVNGTYGVAVICLNYPNQMVGARRGSPLIVGIGDKENLLSSDANAITAHTRRVVYLNDFDVVTVYADDFKVVNIGSKAVNVKISEIEYTAEDAEKGQFAHYMLKEIFEQPRTIENALRGRLNTEESTAVFGGLNLTTSQLRDVERIVITACGTSFHAGLVGEYLFESLAHVPVEVELASEFRYRNAPIEKNTLVLAITQSGETADTLAGLREAKRKGHTVLSICNVVGSTIARESDGGIYLHAGPEIGVASTKAFTSQVTVLLLFALFMARIRMLSAQRGSHLIRELSALPSVIENVLMQNDGIKTLAEKYARAEDFFFLGRLINYPVALEGALKLKEISYVHAEGYSAAEMKHGPIALLDEKTPCVVLVPKDDIYEKVVSNIEVVKARKSPVIALATEGDEAIARLVDDVIYLPPSSDLVFPIISAVPLQLLAYHIAVARGCDVDKPRNLAKSVTVE